MKTRRSSIQIALVLAFGISIAPSAIADLWGTLRGRLVVVGTPPEPTEIDPGPDACCQEAKPVDRRVVVGEAGGLKNAVVYLRPKRGEKVSVHPDLAATPTEPVELANEGCAFVPRVTLLRVGQPLRVTNVDPTSHNTKIEALVNTPFNQMIAAETEVTHAFDEEERLPVPVACNVHPFMKGYVLIRDNPYMAVTDDEGRFEIALLPAGQHQFQFWHETGYLKNVALGANQTDRRGRVRIEIKAGDEIDLGEIKVPAELLKR